MRIAVMIISLCLTAIVGLQSCAVMVSANLAQRADVAGGGASGIIIALLFVLGGAFAMGLPNISMAMFTLAAIIGFIVGATTPYGDMSVWGAVALVLAVLSYFGKRELRQKRQKAPTEA